MLERMTERYSDPARRARLVWWLWLVSTAFMLFGFAVIFYLVLT
jgi:phage shock protein PspC (stress-responsive transcriptional regulator)